MEIKKFALVLVLGLYALAFFACTIPQEEGSKAAPASSPTKPLPLIAYLREGNLWVIRPDGTDARQLASAPEGEAINTHTWSLDGGRHYFNAGLKFFAVSLRDRKVEDAGELTVPPEMTVDRLEIGRDGTTLIIHALDANADLSAPPKHFALTIGKREARELTVDEYQALAQPQSVIIRGFNDQSVSPDGRRLLFKEVVGNHEELSVADIDTGAHHQVTNLSELEGFEESAELLGGRRILEATWSRDGRHIIFIPAQSCSEAGLCYGGLFLTDIWSGAQFRLSLEMMVNIPAEWNREGTWLVYDDGGQVLLADTEGHIKRLAEGNRPKWQPVG